MLADPLITSIATHLPPSVKMGVAPAMALDTSRAFWGSEATGMDEATKKVLGADNACMNNAYGDLLYRNLMSTPMHAASAGKALGHIRYSKRPVDQEGEPMATWVGKSAPREPNVHTDDGLLNPHNRLWSLPAYGVFWRYKRPQTTGNQANDSQQPRAIFAQWQAGSTRGQDDV